MSSEGGFGSFVLLICNILCISIFFSSEFLLCLAKISFTYWFFSQLLYMFNLLVLFKRFRFSYQEREHHHLVLFLFVELQPPSPQASTDIWICLCRRGLHLKLHIRFKISIIQFGLALVVLIVCFFFFNFKISIACCGYSIKIGQLISVAFVAPEKKRSLWNDKRQRQQQ